MVLAPANPPVVARRHRGRTDHERPPCLPLSTRRRHLARPPSSPATSPAQYPAASRVGVSVLFRQPHGSDGFRLASGRAARTPPRLRNEDSLDSKQRVGPGGTPKETVGA